MRTLTIMNYKGGVGSTAIHRGMHLISLENMTRQKHLSAVFFPVSMSWRKQSAGQSIRIWILFRRIKIWNLLRSTARSS